MKTLTLVVQLLAITASAEPLMAERYAPKVPFAFERLSPASIRPQGRWKSILDLYTNGDGWIMRRAKVHDPVFYTMLWERDWDKGDYASGIYGAYTAGAIVRLARLSPDSALARKYRAEWLPRVLASQGNNGYIGCGQSESCAQLDLDGAKRVKRKTPIPRYELMNEGLILELLLWEYEFSGDENVLQAAKRLGKFLIEEYLDPKGMPNDLHTTHTDLFFRGMLQLYRYTGDERIITRLESYFQTRVGIYKSVLQKNELRHHVVDLCYMLQSPLSMYHLTGRKELLELALKGYDNTCDFALQVIGVPTGNEMTHEKGARGIAEHCSSVTWPVASMSLLRSTGQVRFADMAERAVYNAHFGFESADSQTYTYFMAPNQLFATNWTGQYFRDPTHPVGAFRGFYSMQHSPACCVCRFKTLPQLMENAVLSSPDGGLAFVFYGPYTFSRKLAGIGDVTIDQKTDYPFEDDIQFEVTLDNAAEMPIHFRIPEWCRGAELLINGKPPGGEVEPGTFARVKRVWENGDRITLKLDVPIKLEWDRARRSVPGAAVVRGPLVFALPVEADREYIGKGKPGDPSNTDQEAWNVAAAQNALWNVALELDVDDPESSLELVRLSPVPNSLPTEHAPVGLKVKAKKLPNWKFDWNGAKNRPETPALPWPPLVAEGDSLEVTLVPFGFTQIRMTFLPVLQVESTEKQIKHGDHEDDI